MIARRLALLVALLLGLLAQAGPARAYKFGTDDDIRFIQDVTLKGAKDEALFLGHMVKTHFFLAGTYVEDAGYVLGVKGESKSYYPMPTGDDLSRFQRAGTLPNPLPPYSLNAFDYIFGYSLWWLIPLIALFIWWGDRRKKAKAAAATPNSTVPVGGPASGETTTPRATPPSNPPHPTPPADGTPR